MQRNTANNQTTHLLIMLTRTINTADGIVSICANTEKVINYTNYRISEWYKEVKRCYGTIGHGETKFVNNRDAEIHYTEHGVKCIFRLQWQDGFKLDTLFHAWGRAADIETDRVE